MARYGFGNFHVSEVWIHKKQFTKVCSSILQWPSLWYQQLHKDSYHKASPNYKSLNRQFLEIQVSIPVYDFSFPFIFRKSVRQACNTFCINYYDYMAWTMIQTSTKKLHLQKDLFSYDAHNKYSANTTVHPLNLFIISSSYSNDVIRKRLTKKNNK